MPMFLSLGAGKIDNSATGCNPLLHYLKANRHLLRATVHLVELAGVEPATP